MPKTLHAPENISAITSFRQFLPNLEHGFIHTGAVALRAPSRLWTKHQVPVDDFVDANALSFNKFQQDSTRSRKRLNQNKLKTTKFRKV